MGIPFRSTKKFSPLISDYLSESVALKPFYNRFPRFEAFEKQLLEKQMQNLDRELLREVMQTQNSSLRLSDISQKNIDSLSNENTFTVTTGHQLCLFTGPLYFIYKIVSTINLARELEIQFPQNKFIPIFWMASEDHDLEEVNHISLFGETIRWKTEQKGAVGSMSLEGMADLLQELKSTLGESDNAQVLIQLFSDAYLKHPNLAAATRYLVNELFGEYGIVILDGDDALLKKQIIPIVKTDVLEQGFQKIITDCSAELAVNYKAQAYVRPINFFRLSDDSRLRIEGGVSAQEIEDHTEQFSPNVLMRPLYQETVLPNIAYVGGGAEIAYWMQLKTAFEQASIPFPSLVLRNSLLWLEKKQVDKWQQLGFELVDLFLEEHQLHQRYVQRQTDLSLAQERSALEKVFSDVLAKTTDKGMLSSVLAEQQKQLNAFEKLEKKMLRLEKKKHEIALSQISQLKNKLFPTNSLQERCDNFIPYYLKHGENFIKILQEELNPLESNFVILSPQ